MPLASGQVAITPTSASRRRTTADTLGHQRPRNYQGDYVTSLDDAAVLVPQYSISAFLGPPREVRDKNEMKHFGGKVEFKDATGRCMSQRFLVRIDSDGPRTLYDLQQIPKHLREIEKAIERLAHPLASDE